MSATPAMRAAYAALTPAERRVLARHDRRRVSALCVEVAEAFDALHAAGASWARPMALSLRAAANVAPRHVLGEIEIDDLARLDGALAGRILALRL